LYDPLPLSIGLLKQKLTGTDDDARIPTRKLLLKWRPHILEENNNVNGVKQKVQELKQDVKQPLTEAKEPSPEVKDPLVTSSKSPNGISIPPPNQEASHSAVAAMG
jgi:hypothetical protein